MPIGNGVAYNSGVSPGARDYYDKILSYAGDQYAATVMALLTHFEIRSSLGNTVRRQQAKKALEETKTNVINARLNECLDYLIENIEANASCVADAQFKKLSVGHISWP